MHLELSDFHVNEPPRMTFFKEQCAHNEIVMKYYLLEAQSGVTR